MLCPQCGNDVGDKIRLCDDCQAKRQEKLSSERKGEPKPQEVQPTQSASEEETRSAPEESKRTKKRMIILVAALLVTAGGLKLVKDFTRKEVPAIPVEVQLSQSSTPPIETAPTPEPSPIAQEDYEGNVKGGVRFGKDEVRFSKAIGVYFRSNHKMEIAFFRSVEQKLNLRPLRKKESVELVDNIVPDAVLSLTFKSDATDCSLTSVEGYSLRVYRNEGGLPLATPVTTFGVKELGGLSQGIGTAFESLGCSFNDKDKIIGNFRGNKNIVVRDENKILSWDLDFEFALLGPPDGKEVEYDSQLTKSTLGLWNASKGSLDIGFYGFDLTPEEREDIRQSSNLLLFVNKTPDIVLSFGLSPGQTDFSRSSLKTFGVTFYRGGREQLLFPGVDKHVGLFYAGSAQNGGNFKNLTGVLKDTFTISGSYGHTVSKKVSGVDTAFTWNLDFRTTVLDTSVQGTALSLPSEKGTPPANLGAEFGKIVAGASQVNIVSSQSLYYVQGNSLSVGFYSEILSEEERLEAAKKKTVSTYINGKRPVLVAIFELDDTVSGHDSLGMRSCTLYFYREIGGALQFPGFHDVVSIKRTEIHGDSNDELISLNGNLKTGGPISIRLKGRGSVSTIDTEFSWDIFQKVQPRKIE